MSWQTSRALDLSLEALALLGAKEVEVEVSLMEAPIYLEAADRRQVVPVDTRDPAGGFGGIDLWIATLIPVIAAVEGLKQDGLLRADSFDRLVDDLVKRVGSPRAMADAPRLKWAVARVLGLTDGEGQADR